MVQACLSLGVPAFPALNDNNIFNALNDALNNSMGETISNDTFDIAQLYCATSNSGPCYGICPNPDVASLGVRVAFYIQAALNAWMVILSPEDSPAAAWAATLLTAAIIIPAMIQKKGINLTLYHATLALNFATLSSLASLAAAPMCPIWREQGLEQPLVLRELEKKAQENPSASVPYEDEDGNIVDGENHHGPRKKEVTYRRIVLSLALLAQVGLQWAYAGLLFTSPYYAQQSCNDYTVIVLFGAPIQAPAINDGLFGVWVLWLLFNVTLTLAWGVFLVMSGSPSARKSSSRLMRMIDKRDPDGKKRRRYSLYVALGICLLFLGFSEEQILLNCVILSENITWGFGQVAAVLLLAAPLWQIVVAAADKVHLPQHQNSNPSTSHSNAEFVPMITLDSPRLMGEPEMLRSESPVSMGSSTGVIASGSRAALRNRHELLESTS